MVLKHDAAIRDVETDLMSDLGRMLALAENQFCYTSLRYRADSAIITLLTLKDQTSKKAKTFYSGAPRFSAFGNLKTQRKRGKSFREMEIWLEVHGELDQSPVKNGDIEEVSAPAIINAHAAYPDFPNTLHYSDGR